ncbi:DUF2889 domain-containing protein [Novosphingobium sp. JCM 18896]|uniref:DUF2889 domain-containing protein n=1 Tax=Novosphingobium sp. JCM 18896 TaxID=2989731 RepID=UPI002222A5C5|nr:DUF2889 domain-containing protein [Novosphingobium sp. JCM 18896]MCW1431184.1 DUF2889 domain-containing protein [Novosphingobium sp. JCM 18896]
MIETQDLPGYRRRIRIEPRAGVVLAMLEDDMHCMAVTLRHEGGVVSAVEPVMQRAPWTTCPGARAQLVATFAGQPLAEITAKREKRANCTHLHDLAVFAAAHADGAPLVYDVLVSDPIEGERLLELRRDGEPLLLWREHMGVIVEPASASGLMLHQLRDWIATLPADLQEPARVLQWAGLVAHGRTIPIEQQSRATDLPPNCYTFQPERAVAAQRVGALRDFNAGDAEPLDGLAVEQLARL